MENYNTRKILTLISNIHSKVSDYLCNKLAEEGFTNLTSSHGNILYQLSVQDSISMTELAKKVNRDKSTVTVLIRKLESYGLIERVADTKDNRVVYISLSEKGKTCTLKMLEISKDLLTTCYNGFTEEEKTTTLELLMRIYKNFP